MLGGREEEFSAYTFPKGLKSRRKLVTAERPRCEDVSGRRGGGAEAGHEALLISFKDEKKVKS